ncbi:uncharacterized protein BXZ73DRAFT_74475 [Epithele typhae]|uniref:uncharacterized protein n=1 Tax=Epithele typhae TaxID=378194 RepID=UPI002007BBC6|nr:uncharacterized protein BXZ73DRAFT_74475 [Epithele typhae]KAH9942166.1 hypothetical protein BXZ73DRAFT_74475 [Epithele typhae]
MTHETLFGSFVVDYSMINANNTPTIAPTVGENVTAMFNDGTDLNNTFWVITTPTSFWCTFSGFPRVAVYGAVVHYTDDEPATATYSVDGKIAANQTLVSFDCFPHFPLFLAELPDASRQHTLSVDVDARPAAPYLLDYILLYDAPTTTTNSTVRCGVSTPSPTSTTTISAITSTVTRLASSGTPIGALSESSTTQFVIAMDVAFLLLGFMIGCLLYLSIKQSYSRNHDSEPHRAAPRRVGIEPSPPPYTRICPPEEHMLQHFDSDRLISPSPRIFIYSAASSTTSFDTTVADALSGRVVGHTSIPTPPSSAHVPAEERVTECNRSSLRTDSSLNPQPVRDGVRGGLWRVSTFRSTSDTISTALPETPSEERTGPLRQCHVCHRQESAKLTIVVATLGQPFNIGAAHTHFVLTKDTQPSVGGHSTEDGAICTPAPEPPVRVYFEQRGYDVAPDIRDSESVVKRERSEESDAVNRPSRSPRPEAHVNAQPKKETSARTPEPPVATVATNVATDDCL